MLRLKSPITAQPGAGTLPRVVQQASWSTSRRWLARHSEILWVLALVLLGALAHGINMQMVPYFENDEGTYMSQAWAVLKQGQLAPYTYWYDHAPGGWLVLAVWAALTGGFHTFGQANESGRVLMLLFQCASTAMVYLITRNITRNVVAASLATLVFVLSPYGIFYHRRVLLDNITVVFMLASILPLVLPRLTLTRVWVSAVALALSILSKELTVFLIPVLAYLVFHRADRTQRLFATVGWLALAGSITSLYFLLAMLKGELFPPGVLGSGPDHVSLLGTLSYQAGRKSGAFNQYVTSWLRDEPTLVAGGTIAAIINIALIRWQRLAGVIGLLTLSLWLFVIRGGVILDFYLVPLLPLLAISLGCSLAVVQQGLARLTRRVGWLQLASIGATGVAAFAGIGYGLSIGYRSPSMGLDADSLHLWRGIESQSYSRATNFVVNHLPASSAMLIDMYMWLDLHDRADGGPAYNRAHYYWKVEKDPAIRTAIFNNAWETTDYIVQTRQMSTDAQRENMTLVSDALAHATAIVNYDADNLPVDIFRTDQPHTFRATEQPVLQRSWQQYKASFMENGRVIDRGNGGISTSEGQSYAMLRAVYMDDRASFDSAWNWAKANLATRGDGLMAWKWGAQPNGTNGVLDKGSATDAEQDTALALLFAARRWNEPHYSAAANQILAAMWQQETTVINGQRVLVAGDWARGEQGGAAIINPSYFAPYAYRIFAEADPARPWASLIDSSYNLIGKLQATHNGLVPNWAAINPKTGEPGPATTLFGDYAEQFSYDASRVPFRLTLDWLWYGEARAKSALLKISQPTSDYRQRGAVAASYTSDGKPAVGYNALSMYAGVIPGMLATDPVLAQQAFTKQLLRVHAANADGSWSQGKSYYDENWAWFTTALMDGGMSNLWHNQQTIDWRMMQTAKTP